MIQSKLFLSFNKIQHYFFDKYDPWEKQEYSKVIDNCTSPDQVHGNRVIFVYGEKKKYRNCDGLVTNKGFYLGIRTADCLPILLYDPIKEIIGAVHAGWRGLLSGILENAIKCMREKGTKAKNIFAVIGPHIGVCCYKVTHERIMQFENKFKDIIGITENKKGEWYMDLAKIASWEMSKLGLPGKNIDILQECTSCNLNYFSYRRDGISGERIWSVIGIKL